MEKCRKPSIDVCRRHRVVVDTFPLSVGACESFGSALEALTIFLSSIVEKPFNPNPMCPLTC